jgi:hypothetical protein
MFIRIDIFPQWISVKGNSILLATRPKSLESPIHSKSLALPPKNTWDLIISHHFPHNHTGPSHHHLLPAFLAVIVLPCCLHTVWMQNESVRQLFVIMTKYLRKQLKGRKVYFGSQFMVTWLHCCLRPVHSEAEYHVRERQTGKSQGQMHPSKTPPVTYFF